VVQFTEDGVRPLNKMVLAQNEEFAILR